MIHQIFVDIGKGKSYSDNPIYREFVEENKKRHPNLQHKIWDEKMLDDLVEKYPEYLDFWNSFPHPFYKIDFARYLILYDQGGIYIDMDDVVLEPIVFDRNLIATYEKDGKKEFCNNIIYFHNRNDYKKLMDFCLERKKSCKMPMDWKHRRFLYIVGVRCYHYFVKHQLKLPFKSTIKFKSKYTTSWLNVVGN